MQTKCYKSKSEACFLTLPVFTGWHSGSVVSTVVSPTLVCITDYGRIDWSRMNIATCIYRCWNGIFKKINKQTNLVHLNVFLCSSRTWRVVLGDHDIYNHEGREQYMSVSAVHIHPNWNSNSVSSGCVNITYTTYMTVETIIHNL